MTRKRSGIEARVTWRRFENAAFRAYTNVFMASQSIFTTVRVIRDNVKFCDSSESYSAQSLTPMH